MKSEKLTRDLAKVVALAAVGDLVEVVLEIDSRAATAARACTSRLDKVRALKEVFARESVPVTAAIEELGGEVTGSAWVSQTVRARVPARGLDELSRLDSVTLLDVPHRMSP